MDRKLETLKERLRGLESCAVAFSGGQDSAFLLDVAREVLGSRTAAVSVLAPYTLKRDMRRAHGIIGILGVEHRSVEVPLLEELRYNPEDRCYLCKDALLECMIREKESLHMSHLVDGTHVDDKKEHRPGMRALEERGVLSPLREAGFTRDEITALLHERGRGAWTGPADTCLLTRLPRGCEVTPETLTRIEMAEEFLLDEGFTMVRVRSDGMEARIEVAPGERRRFFHEEMMGRVAARFKKLGFGHVAVDLEGYRSGSMD